MPRGCGAYISHRYLESKIPGYQVIGYDPRLTYFPPFLPILTGKKKADIIHTTPDHAIFFSRIDIPLVITFRNYVLDPFMKNYSSIMQWIHYQTDLKLFTSMAIKRANAITAVSKSTAKLVKSHSGFRGSIEIIPNGIDENIYMPPSSRTPKKNVKVLFSGNPTNRKGAHWLQPIAEKVAEYVEIIVTGGLRSISVKMSGRIKFIKKILPEKMPELYKSVDILLLPTVREGLSRAALEAMSAGLPIVSTNISSMPELIHHGKGGYLCNLGDVDAFSSAINKLAENENLRDQMGEYNRSRIVTEFSAKKMIDNYIKLFERVI